MWLKLKPFSYKRSWFEWKIKKRLEFVNCMDCRLLTSIIHFSEMKNDYIISLPLPLWVFHWLEINYHTNNTNMCDCCIAFPFPWPAGEMNIHIFIFKCLCTMSGSFTSVSWENEIVYSSKNKKIMRRDKQKKNINKYTHKHEIKLLSYIKNIIYTSFKYHKIW